MTVSGAEAGVLVCGEALFDVFPDPAGPVAGVWPMVARAGGSPFNVAIGLARLGRKTAFLGGLSTDPMGIALAGQLDREGVDASPSPRLPHRTTLSVVARDAAGHPAYAFYGEGSADRSLEAAMPGVAPTGFGAIHVGSYSLVVEPSGSTIAGLVARAQAVLVCYDPNVRLTVQPDRDLWRLTVAAICRQASVVKVSAEDLALLYPHMAAKQAAESLLAYGPALVVMTDGAEGASAWTRRCIVERPAHAVTVVDTVGAGDSFMACLIDGLLASGARDRATTDGLDPAQIASLLDRCARAAALTCSRPGADPPRQYEL